MKKMRALIERYEKWLMIGLVVFLCVIFTVTADIEAFFAGEGREVAGANDVIGSFYVVPDQEVEVTNARYARARLALRVLQDVTRGMGSDDVGVLEVWSHLILAEAAAHEGVYVSDEELVTTMRTINPSLGAIMQDPERYKEFVQNRYGINPPPVRRGVPRGPDLAAHAGAARGHVSPFRRRPPARNWSSATRRASSSTSTSAGPPSTRRASSTAPKRRWMPRRPRRRARRRSCSRNSSRPIRR